jgi:hypothetical protein
MNICAFRINRKGEMKEYKIAEKDFIVPLILFLVASSSQVDVYAAGSGTITKALQPIISLFKDLARPVALANVYYSGISLMLGKKTEFKSRIRDVALGYGAIQLADWFLDIIENIGKT